MTRRRVVKVGGSLLTHPQLIPRLRRWLADDPCAATLIIVGGGRLVDAVRRLDHARPIDPSIVHWICVDLLHATQQILHAWLPEATLIRTASDLDDWKRQPRLAIASPRCFYDATRMPGADDTLPPEDWRTTTDTIAALLATDVDAHELVILKSCDVTAASTDTSPDRLIDRLVREGVLDAAFIDPSGRPRFPADKTRLMTLQR